MRDAVAEKQNGIPYFSEGSAMTNEPILSLSNISKAFPGVKALNHVSIDFYKGEVHAIVGENGAGKSTLMKIISGVYIPDSP